MKMVELVTERNEEALREWAERESAALAASEDPAYHDVQDATDPHGPAMQVVLAADRGEITREQRAWALRIVGEAYDSHQPLQEMDA